MFLFSPTEGSVMSSHSRRRKNLRKRLFNQQDGCCFYCHRKVDIECENHNAPEAATLEHLIPKSKGGSSRVDNLVVSCRECNVTRGISPFHPVTGERINEIVKLSPCIRPSRSNGMGNFGKGMAALAAALLLAVPFTSWAVTAFVRDVQWTQNVEGHLKRAADANSPEMALEEIQLATKFLEENKLTKGNTGIIYQTPQTDINFWYMNLKVSEFNLVLVTAKEGERIGLIKVDKAATQAEKDMVLLKLRQTLLDHGGQKGEHVTQPPNMYVYPNVLAYTIWFWAGLILLFPACICGFMAFYLWDIFH